jgi:antitoxin component of MazEF toxin-antitoxin module
MSRVVVGKWGRSLAVRVPFDVARQSGLGEGEQVEIEAQNGDIVIRRDVAHARARQAAEAAATEIAAESRRHSLEGLSIRDLRDEGRRG